MYGTDAADSVDPKPTPAAPSTENYFTNAGNGAIVDADWMNLVQESLLNVLDDQSIAHSKTDYTGLRQAVNAIVSAKFAAVNVGAPGSESGLIYSAGPGGTAKFNITAGECRDTTNVQTMKTSTGFSNLEAETAWSASGPGVQPSGMSLVSSSWFRVFALGKTTSDVMSIAIDDNDLATNALSDAASDGFTLFRHIGWMGYNSSGFPVLGPACFLVNQDPINRNFWRVDPSLQGAFDGDGFKNFGTPPVRDAYEARMFCPPNVLHVGAYNMSGEITQSDNFWTIGGDSTIASPSATNHSFFFRGYSSSPTKHHHFQMVPTYEKGSGPSNRGYAWGRLLQNSSGVPRLFWKTIGWFWSRELL